MNKENSKKITALGVVIFSFIALGICFMIVFAVDALAAALILKTSLPESTLVIGNVIGSCLGTVAASFFLTVKGRVKGIYSAVIVGGSVVAIKIIGNAVLKMGGYLNWSGLIGVLFVAVFALVGGAAGAMIRR